MWTRLENNNYGWLILYANCTFSDVCSEVRQRLSHNGCTVNDDDNEYDCYHHHYRNQCHHLLLGQTFLCSAYVLGQPNLLWESPKIVSVWMTFSLVPLCSQSVPHDGFLKGPTYCEIYPDMHSWQCFCFQMLLCPWGAGLEQRVTGLYPTWESAVAPLRLFFS